MQRLILFGLIFGLTASYGQYSTADSGGYKGPAVLTGAGYPTGRYLGQPMQFQWHAGARAIYSTDVTPATVDADGNLIKFSSAGALIHAGGSGVRHGRHSTFAADILAGYRYHNRNVGRDEDGLDFGGSLGYSRQIDARNAFEIGAVARSYEFSSGGTYTPTVEIPIEGVEDPAESAFDSRTTSAGVSGGWSHSFTRRWSFVAKGSAYITERDSDSLISSRGWRAGGSAMYRLSESASTGAGYAFSNFYSPGGFGETWTHVVYWTVRKRFQNRWSVSANAGAFYSEFDRVAVVPLDPVLAAIVGQATVLEPFSETSTGPSISLTASRAFQRSGLSFYYRHGIMPGTAFFVSGETDVAGAQYSITTSRKANVGFGVNWSRATTPGDTLTHEGYGAHAGFSYRIGGGFHFSASGSYYNQNVTRGNFNRDRVLVSAGIVFGSGPRAVSLF